MSSYSTPPRMAAPSSPPQLQTRIGQGSRFMPSTPNINRVMETPPRIPRVTQTLVQNSTQPSQSSRYARRRKNRKSRKTRKNRKSRK